MLSYPADSWLAVYDKDVIKGIVSVGEIVRQSRLSPRTHVGEFVTQTPVLQATDTAKKAVQQMLSANVSWVRVIDSRNTLLGFITPQQLRHLRLIEYEDETIKSSIFTRSRIQYSPWHLPNPDDKVYE